MNNGSGEHAEENGGDWWDEEPNQDTALAVMETSTAAALNRSEVMVQLDAAHKYGRSMTRFMKQAISLATVDTATAESCMYALPRGGKTISGPSVRLAEIVASTYGNLHIGARVVGAGDRTVTAQGVAWDLESNLRVTIEVERRITNSKGGRYNDDMITVTGAAAASIALRNAIFRVVPRALVDQIYDRCRAVAVGNAQTLTKRRDEVLARLAKMGADNVRVLNALKIKGVDDITLEHLETLIGMGTAVKQGDKALDELFPAPVAEVPGADQPGRKMSLKKPEGKTEAPKTEVKAPAQGWAEMTGPGEAVAHHTATCSSNKDPDSCDCGAIAAALDGRFTKAPTSNDEEPIEAAVERWRDMFATALKNVDKAPAEKAKREIHKRLGDSQDERYGQLMDEYKQTIDKLKSPAK